MIKLPKFEKTREYENNFYLSCENIRFSKFLAHYELFKMIENLPGAIVECGVFKGISFVRFAGFRELFRNSYAHRLIGFDTFGKFPETKYEADKELRNSFIRGAGEQSISKEQLYEVLKLKGVNRNIELVEGDICVTVPEYVKNHPELKISLLNLSAGRPTQPIIKGNTTVKTSTALSRVFLLL